MKTPVLFILFNRLDTTQQVFASIHGYKPKQLFVAADGPRVNRKGESEKCQHVREWVLSSIDWDCEVKTLFQSDNLGCGKGPATAISWFFENVEEGIILEDDCVPHPDFYVYCEQMLNYYRNDNRISIISGSNFDIYNLYGTEDSYFFSIFPYTWGWATWKRNWITYDYYLKEWNHIKKNDFLKKNIFKEKKYYLSWKNIFDNLSTDTYKDIWDYQFFYQCFKKKQFSVVPSHNLISNIGSGDTATHTLNVNDAKLNIEMFSLSFPLKHPKEIRRNIKYDENLQKLNYGEIEQVSLLKKLKRYIKRVLKEFNIR